MMKITCVAGLSGSGKTPLTRQRVVQGGAGLDDVYKGIPHTLADLEAKVSPVLATGKDCIITDVIFCEPEERRQLESVLRRLAPAAEVE